ncbi:MAG: hypothetical protein HY238_01615 [Acidobacteria bacterium]|nr:hypothetical protein [Acidobacteriota bacterium]
MPHSSWLSRPAAVGAAIVVLLAGRWIWVAGLGDYGWDYEIAARLLRGEIFYRDFLLTRGPLSYYTLAGSLRLLGQHLFVHHLHLWFSYVLCLGPGLLLAQELGATRSAQITGVSLAAVVACPVFGWGHALCYQSIFLAGLGTLFTMYAQRKSPWWAALAGGAAALCIFDKQNVGIAVAISIPLFLRQKRLGIYLAAFAFVFLSVFACFASRAGGQEVWRQLFSDAVASKGGWLLTAGRAIPRLIFRPDLPLRRWWELAATAAVYAALLPVAVRLSRRRSAGGEQEQFSSGVGLACLAAACLAIAVSLLRLHIPVPRNLLIHPWSLLLQLTYILFFLASVSYVLRWREAGWTTALGLVLVITAAGEASNPNFVYSAALVLPVLCALLARTQVTLRPRTAGIALAVVYVMGTTGIGPISFHGLHAYQPTYPLPSGSPFAGLRAPAGYSLFVSELWDQARPILKNRKTLWLLNGGGPYLAFGGAPVFAAPHWRSDTFPLRLDQRLIQSWQADPPEVVMLGDDFHPSKSELLAAGYIKKQVLSGSVQIWRSQIEPQVGLWVLAPPSAAPRQNP